MDRITRAAVLVVALIGALGALSSSAGAVTWHNTGSTAFTATSGPFTFSTTSAGLNCTGSTSTGTAPSTTVGVTYSMTMTTTFSGCTLGGVTTGWECNERFTMTSQSGGVTSGTLDVTCGIYQYNSKLCHMGGSWPATYTNPVLGVGVLDLVTGGNLFFSNATAGTCPFGNGDRMHASAVTRRTTSANPPVITRTA